MGALDRPAPGRVLVDVNPNLVAAWREHFASFPEVDIRHGDILKAASHALVSPANSYGYMDGGIDQQYATFFGAVLTRAVQAAIAARPEGLLPVGAALALETAHARIKYLIVAPTMEFPGAVPAINAQRAMRAILRVVSAQRELATDVYCPGLGAGTGRIPPDDCAREMAEGYAAWSASPKRA